LRLPDGAVVIVANTRRQINQEDSPLQERTLIITEGDSSSVASMQLMFSSRAAGAEETVEGTELLAAMSFPPRAETHLVFAHDFGDERSYSVVERTRTSRWALRWASPRFSC
jgi:hypothetical protein